MNSRIQVRSELGKGSSFSFQLTCPIAEKPQAECRGNVPLPPVQRIVAESRPDKAKPLRLLVAEDNPTNRLLALRLLEKQGHKVTLVCDGTEVLQILDTAEFDAVLMDIQMPKLDGFQTTAQIRERERSTGKHLPIVALTAHAMVGYSEACLKAGMDGYLSKPINVQELYRVLEKMGRDLEKISQ